MKILGIDTSTKFLCLGLADKDKTYEYVLEVGPKLSGVLVPTINRALEAVKWNLKDIDYFACGLGPGSFTGIRVGLATIKGFSWALNKPVVGIPTLDLLAQNASYVDGFIISAIDAKRELIYCRLYRADKGILKKLTPSMLLTAQEILAKIKQKIPRRANTVLLGDGFNILKNSLLNHNKNITILDKDYWGLLARNIIELARQKIKTKDIARSADVEPIYLYPKECQIRR